jgi:hypothetical protein
MTFWWNGNLTKLKAGEIVKSMKWPVDEMTSWQNGKFQFCDKITWNKRNC